MLFYFGTAVAYMSSNKVYRGAYFLRYTILGRLTDRRGAKIINLYLFGLKDKIKAFPNHLYEETLVNNLCAQMSLPRLNVVRCVRTWSNDLHYNLIPLLAASIV